MKINVCFVGCAKFAARLMVEAAHEKRTKTPTTFFVTVYGPLNT
jgi:hypothetical protein